MLNYWPVLQTLNSASFVSNSFTDGGLNRDLIVPALSLHMDDDFEGAMTAVDDSESAAFPSLSEGFSIRILNELPDAKKTLLLESSH